MIHFLVSLLKQKKNENAISHDPNLGDDVRIITKDELKTINGGGNHASGGSKIG